MNTKQHMKKTVSRTKAKKTEKKEQQNKMM